MLFCIFFILLLGLVISIVNYRSFNRALYERYNNYLSDALRYLEYNINEETDKKYKDLVEEEQEYIRKIADPLIKRAKIVHKNKTHNNIPSSEKEKKNEEFED